MTFAHVDLRNRAAQEQLTQSLAALRDELGLHTDFPASVEAEAARAAHARQLPERDLTALAFITIDPPGATDLDQALHLERRGGGYRVWYAIADVPSLVEPGSLLDAETRRRGQTVYAPDGRIPLHPDVIAEDAGSLLPGQLRSAFVWEFNLDAAAEVSSVSVRRARVRSRSRLDYSQVQQEIDDAGAGGGPENLVVLKEIGVKRIELERLRGGASLNLPEQEITRDGERYVILTRPPLPAEDWNAQISLMTGMAAAQLMLDGRVGILRTMPAPDAASVAKFRRQARALGRSWPEEMPYGEFLRGLDTRDPRQLALMHAAGSLFRGAGYTAFDGEVPDGIVQAAIAAPYAHATAPLRRLVDRFVLVVCEALCAGVEVPAWARDALPELGALMNVSGQLASRLDRGALDAVEAAVLSNRVGEKFDAVVLTANGNGARAPDTLAGPNGNGAPYGTVQLTDPPVEARCSGVLEPGSTVRVRLVAADILQRTVCFELA